MLQKKWKVRFLFWICHGHGHCVLRTVIRLKPCENKSWYPTIRRLFLPPFSGAIRTQGSESWVCKWTAVSFNTWLPMMEFETLDTISISTRLIAVRYVIACTKNIYLNAFENKYVRNTLLCGEKWKSGELNAGGYWTAAEGGSMSQPSSGPNVLTHWGRGHLNCLNARYRVF